MSIRKLLLSGVLGCAVLVSASTVRAAGCEAEIEKLCKNERPIMKCLRAKQADLSPGCSAYLAFFEKIPSCVADASRLCPTDKPSGAGVIACLRGRQTDLSEECRKEMGNIR